MRTLDKIFMTASSTASVHTCHYIQHKMKDPQRGFNHSHSNFLEGKAILLFHISLKVLWIYNFLKKVNIYECYQYIL